MELTFITQIKKILSSNIMGFKNEDFNFKWLRRRGFWRVLYFGFLAKFKITTYNYQEKNNVYVSYGTQPIDELNKRGFIATKVGHVFKVPIWWYELL